jgi:DNA-binding PadR family transcriptional regulator
LIILIHKEVSMHWGRFHHGGPFGGRMFRRGDFKYLILDMLKDKPRYGYEIIKELEDRCGGIYMPSAGVVYPTLQYFEELGYVTAQQQDGKKVYTITDEGRKFLKEQEKVINQIHENMKGWCGMGHGREFPQMMREIGRLARLCGHEARRADADKVKRMREILVQACADIEKVLAT